MRVKGGALMVAEVPVLIDEIHRDTGHAVRPICKVLGVPRSRFYHAATPTRTVTTDRIIGFGWNKSSARPFVSTAIAESTQNSSMKGLFVIPRECTVSWSNGLQPKNYVPKTSDGKADKPSPNRLLNAAMPTAPDAVWAGDITFVPITDGWLYLAVVIDLCSRRIEGWSIADNRRAELFANAFQQALKSRNPKPGLIFHSDRGSQYGSKLFRGQLEKAGALQSLSAKANPYDNVWTESFMGRLKAEMLQGGSFTDAKDAQTELFAFIESYYNTRRRHSSLGYKTPFQFEALFNSQK